MRSIRVLLVEDTEDDAVLISNELRRGGFEPLFTRVESEEAFRKGLAEGGWDAIISDFNLPGFSGLGALAIVKELRIDAPFLLVSGTVGEAQAVEAMRMGAQDYIMKDNLIRLGPALLRELNEFERRRQSEAMLREKEKQLRDAQRLELIGQLAGGLAHDFNNILGVIDLQTESVLGAPSEPGSVEKSASEIQKAVGRASNLVQQLLTIGRQRSISITSVSINQLILDTESMLRISLGAEKNLRLVLGPEIPKIHADASQLEQVLVNLIVNARDALPPGGEVSIETSHAIPAEALSSEVTLTVRDNGCGMDNVTRSRIFEPFFTTKEIGKGSGLGLSSVHSIVQQHGAKIFVESELGRGTAFHIVFQGETPHDERRSFKTSQ